MLEVEKLTLLRVMVGQPNAGEWADDILISYLAIAGAEIIRAAYPYDDSVVEVPRRYGYLQCEIASYLLNKRGAEGQTAHSENGVNRTYGGAHVPADMLKGIVPHVGGF